MTFGSAIDYSYYSHYTEGDETIKQKMETTYSQAITINQAFWSEADRDTRFEAGDQTLWNDYYGNLPAAQRKVFNFNRIRRIKNMICGHQRRNRKTLQAIPIEHSDQMTSDQLTKILIWAIQRTNGLETISETFEGSVVTGMNLLSLWMDYRADPINGDINIERVPYNAFLIDPFFTKKDLSDCNFLWQRKWMTKKQAIALMPSRAKEISTLSPRGNVDGKFQFMPQSYNYSMQDLLTYDEYWYMDSRQQTLLVDTQTGETREWEGKKEDLEIFLRTYPQIVKLETDIPSVKLAISIQGNVYYHGPNPMGIDSYPFVPMWCYYDPQIPYFPYRIQGVVRNLIDSQYLYNRRKVIELDILESQINSGYKYKEDAVINTEDLLKGGQGTNVAIKRNASLADVEKIQPPGIPPSMLEISRSLGEEITQISGVNEELLGSATDEKAGILSMLRQGAGLTTLQGIFDNLDYSTKMLGRLMIDLIQANFSPGKIKRITNEEPSSQFYSKTFGKYDCTVIEGKDSATAQQLLFSQIVELIGILERLGMPPSEALLEQLLSATTIQDKEKIIQSLITQQEASQQSASQASQMEEQKKMAEIKDLLSRAEANTGLGLERAARVQENRALAVERIAEAKKDRELGALHLVKALKELEGMDISHLQDLISTLQDVKQIEGLESEVEQEKIETPSVEEIAVVSEGEQ